MKIQPNKLSFLFVTIAIFVLSLDIYSSDNETELSTEERKEILKGFYTEIETLKREYLRTEADLKKTLAEVSGTSEEISTTLPNVFKQNKSSFEYDYSQKSRFKIKREELIDAVAEGRLTIDRLKVRLEKAEKIIVQRKKQIESEEKKQMYFESQNAIRLEKQRQEYEKYKDLLIKLTAVEEEYKRLYRKLIEEFKIGVFTITLEKKGLSEYQERLDDPYCGRMDLSDFGIGLSKQKYCTELIEKKINGIQTDIQKLKNEIAEERQRLEERMQANLFELLFILPILILILSREILRHNLITKIFFVIKQFSNRVKNLFFRVLTFMTDGFNKIKDSFLGVASKDEDFYELLGIDIDANTKEIEEAYNRMVLIYGPIENTSEEAKDKYRKIKTAFNTLKSPIKRYIYDFMRKL